MPLSANPPPSRSGACNCLALRQASRRVTQLYDQALAPAGLRATQFAMLARMREMRGATMKDLARDMVMDRATLGHNLRPLHAQGLVELRVGADRRSRVLALTPAGMRRLRRGMALWSGAQVRFEAAFGTAEAASLRAVLARVAAVQPDAAAAMQ